MLGGFGLGEAFGFFGLAEVVEEFAGIMRIRKTYRMIDMTLSSGWRV